MCSFKGLLGNAPAPMGNLEVWFLNFHYGIAWTNHILKSCRRKFCRLPFLVLNGFKFSVLFSFCFCSFIIAYLRRKEVCL